MEWGYNIMSRQRKVAQTHSSWNTADLLRGCWASFAKQNARARAASWDRFLPSTRPLRVAFVLTASASCCSSFCSLSHSLPTRYSLPSPFSHVARVCACVCKLFCQGGF